MKNFIKQSTFLVLIAFSLVFTSCQKPDEDMNDLLVVKPAKNLYFYGSDAEFGKLQGVEIAHISTEEQLEDIIKTAGDSYALFVGTEIDVRSGLVDNLRNTGILVTQLEGNSDVAKGLNVEETLPFQATLLKEETSNAERTFNVEESLDDDLHFVTYLSVNGEHKILGSVFENMKQAVPRILEWGEKKVEKTKKASAGRSSISKTRVVSLDFDFVWNQVGDFAIDTEVFHADTPSYRINDGSGTMEYADMYIYDHKVSATPANWNVNNVQVIQYPKPWGSNSGVVDYSLRKYSPLNSSNGVLSGRTGSDSYGFSFNSTYGGSLTGPSASVGGGYNWSHTTGWSIPASEVNTYHNPAQERFQVMYDVDPNGSWSGNSVTAENYAYYASNADAVGRTASQYDTVIVYYINTVRNNHQDRDFYAMMDNNRRLKVWKFHSGYFNNPNHYGYSVYWW